MRGRILAIALAVAVAVPAASALGTHTKFRTHPKIKLTRSIEHDTFSGRVKSVREACKRNRRLKLVLHAGGDKPETVAKERSNRRGRWKVRINDENDQADTGQWQIVARRARVRTDSGSIICMRGASDRTPIS